MRCSLVLAALVATGCYASHDVDGEPIGGPAVSLIVELRSDLTTEVGGVVRVLDVGREERFVVSPGADLIEGVVVGELLGLPPREDRDVELELDLSDGTLVTRRVQVDNLDDVAVTFVFTRGCGGVVCPGDGMCIRGACVDPVCPGPECECVADGDCPSDPDPLCGTVCFDNRCLTYCE